MRPDIYTLDDDLDGFYAGEYQLVAAPSDVFTRPPRLLPPFNALAGPVQHVTINAYTKGHWTFRDGSSLAAVGTANSTPCIPPRANPVASRCGSPLTRSLPAAVAGTKEHRG